MMAKKFVITKLILLITMLGCSLPIFLLIPLVSSKPYTPQEKQYWFILYRKLNKELLYYGVPGDQEHSSLVKKFIVKTGQPGKRPTPLPQLMGRDYWNIINALETTENPETAPYFLTLDIPQSEEEPFGPTPYEECNGQCNWELPGPFGLHGIASDSARLSNENEGSSGCVRHTDEDITYLYSLLNNSWPVRYYIHDS
jgi:hypothetical protein